MTDTNFTVQDVISDENGVSSFDAAAATYYTLPPARNIAREVLGRLELALEVAWQGAYVCSQQCNEKAFDRLRKNLDNVVRAIDLNRIRDDVNAITKECRDVSYEREEHLRKRLAEAWAESHELRCELESLKKRACIVGLVREESWT
jgi:hypothetical protein